MRLRLIDDFRHRGRKYSAISDMDSYLDGEEELVIIEDGVDMDIFDVDDDVYELVTKHIMDAATRVEELWVTITRGELYVELTDLYYAYSVVTNATHEVGDLDIVYVPGLTMTEVLRDIAAFDVRVEY